MKYYKAAQTDSQDTDKLNIEVWAPVWYSIEQLFVITSGNNVLLLVVDKG